MTVSIIVRAFNEEKYIRKLFEGIQKQKFTQDIETILVDSGSTDRTVDIAKNFPVKIIQIDPKDFTFGYSLNVGVEASSGDLCVAVSAHCFPENEYWLEHLLAPFQDGEVALVYGRQIGNEKTAFSEHQILERWFPKQDEVNTQLAFANNANSAFRKAHWEQKRFNEELTGFEDLDFAKDVLAKGKHIHYVADACVYHIHEQDLKGVYNRYYREALAYKQIFRNQHFSFTDFVYLFFMNAVGDSIKAIQQKCFFKSFGSILSFRLMQFYSTYRAHKYRESIPYEMKKRLYYPTRPRLDQSK